MLVKMNKKRYAELIERTETFKKQLEVWYDIVKYDSEHTEKQLLKDAVSTFDEDRHWFMEATKKYFDFLKNGLLDV